MDLPAWLRQTDKADPSLGSQSTIGRSGDPPPAPVGISPGVLGHDGGAQAPQPTQPSSDMVQQQMIQVSTS